MKYISLLAFLASCSDVSFRKNHDPWSILDHKSLGNLNSSRVMELLGNADEVIDRGTDFLWIYRNPKSGRQNWAIGVLKATNEVRELKYLPFGDGRPLYISDLESRWSKLSCKHIKKTVLVAGHHYKPERTYACEDGKLIAEFNHFNNEVDVINYRR